MLVTAFSRYRVYNLQLCTFITGRTAAFLKFKLNQTYIMRCGRLRILTQRLPCSPVALDRPPVTHDQHHVPRIGELVLRYLHAWLVSNALGVSFNLLARQSSVAANTTYTQKYYFCTRKAGPKKPLYLLFFFLLLESLLSGPKIPRAFLTRSGAQRSFAHTFVLTLPTDLPSQIFHLFPN